MTVVGTGGVLPGTIETRGFDVASGGVDFRRTLGPCEILKRLTFNVQRSQGFDALLFSRCGISLHGIPVTVTTIPCSLAD